MTAIESPKGIVKRSVAISGHRTSISLEGPFWDVLRQIAEREAISIQKLIGRIDAERGEQNLSSAIRVFVVMSLQVEISRQGEPGSPVAA
jgi:predicted DNA-binding ribbon-helix-helix protein